MDQTTLIELYSELFAVKLCLTRLMIMLASANDEPQKFVDVFLEYAERDIDAVLIHGVDDDVKDTVREKMRAHVQNLR
jgi:hypothetical protein